jgi:hypothetical protein
MQNGQHLLLVRFDRDQYGVWGQLTYRGSSATLVVIIAKRHDHNSGLHTCKDDTVEHEKDSRSDPPASDVVHQMANIPDVRADNQSGENARKHKSNEAVKNVEPNNSWKARQEKRVMAERVRGHCSFPFDAAVTGPGSSAICGCGLDA